MTGTVPAPSPHSTAEKLADLRSRLELAKEPGGEKAGSRVGARFLQQLVFGPAVALAAFFVGHQIFR